jgi:hypothetical protein
LGAFNYNRSRATAERLIKKFGMAGAVRRQTNTGPAYDPAVITTDYPCRLVVLDYDDAKIDGTLIRRSDKLIYLSTEGLAVMPTGADAIVAEAAYQIIDIKPLSPAGVVVFWEIQARS